MGSVFNNSRENIFRHTLITARAISSCLIIAFLLLLSTSESNAQPTTTGSQGNGAATETIEGCFNEFDAHIIVEMDHLEINNKRCQDFCSENRFALAATSGTSCLCGNDYPTVFHRVDPSNCNFPCSPDKYSCVGVACCGSQPGSLDTFYTVSFSGEIVVAKQLLRQLTFDYRNNNPQFRSHIEKNFDEMAALEIANAPIGQEKTYLGLGAVCPDGWESHDGSCYQVRNGELINFNDANHQCQTRGGTLVNIDSEEENTYVRSITGGHNSWIGLTQQGHLGTWDFVNYEFWAPTEPNDYAGLMRASTMYGTDKRGIRFDDYVYGIMSMETLRLSYNDKRITAMQAVYRLWNGNQYEAPIKGFIGKRDSIVELNFEEGEDIYQVDGKRRNWIEELSVTTVNKEGKKQTYGPYGGSRKKSDEFIHFTGNAIVGFFGHFQKNKMTQLGFYERKAENCGRMNSDGSWSDIACDMEQLNDIVIVCERHPDETKIDCTNGWTSFGNSCYQVFDGKGKTWEAAKTECHRRAARLVSIDSREENDFIQQEIGGESAFLGFKELELKKNVWKWDKFSLLRSRDDNDRFSGAKIKNLSSDVSSRNGESCTVQAPDGEWDEISCSETREQPIICEKEPEDNLCSCPTSWESFECQCYKYFEPSAKSWYQAQDFCENNDAELVNILSKEENEFINILAKKNSIYIGLNDISMAGDYEWNHYSRWAEEEPKGNDQYQCAYQSKSGNWITHPCEERHSSYVCEMPQSTAQAGRSWDYQQWKFINANEKLAIYGETVQVHLTHADTGILLGINDRGEIYQTFKKDDNSKWNIVVNDYHQTFALYNELTNYFISVNEYLHGVHGADSGGAGRWSDRNHGRQLQEEDIAYFRTDKIIDMMTYSLMKLSITYQDTDDQYPSHCEMAVYDMTPTSESYKCWVKDYDTGGKSDNYVIFQQVAIYFQDGTETRATRVPLENGRTRCENSSPTETTTCSVAYGEGLTFETSMSVSYGTSVTNGFTIAYENRFTLGATMEFINTQGPVATSLSVTVQNQFINTASYSFSGTFTRDYSVTQTQAYVETRNWQVAVPVPPLSTSTIQFWMSTVDLYYLWQALFVAKGGFDIDVLGQKVGEDHSIGDLSYIEDLYFYMYGTYFYPAQAEVIVTVDDIEASTYDFEIPEFTQISGTY